MFARLTLLSAALAVVLAAPASAAAPCPTGARCATLTVPLDHTGVFPGTQQLAYALLPATGPKVGTIAFLAGGPGQSAIPLVSSVAEVLKAERPGYDILFLDQRGTGDSGAVSCDLSATTCATALGDRRPFMTTVETAKDLEDVRIAIGAPSLVVLGVSYGTKVAGEYARRFPATTAALVLDSTVSTDGLDALGLGEIKSAPRMLTEVCDADAACKKSIKSLPNALTQAVHQLQRHVIRARAVSPSGEVIGSLRVRENALLNLISAADLDPVLRSELPADIEALAHGDGAPLVHSVLNLPNGSNAAFDYTRRGMQDDDGINNARYFATFCTESGLPWAPDSPVAGRGAAVPGYLAAVGAAAFGPFKPASVYANSTASLCSQWPPTAKPEPVPAAGPPVRTLIISGRDDTRTPLEGAQQIATTYPNVRLLAVPDTGHSVLRNDVSGCATDGLAAFLAGGEPVPCEQRTGAKKPKPLIQALPYRAATVGGLPALPGAKGKPAHTAVAVLVTLEGVFHDALGEGVRSGLTRATRIPGLRSGSITASRSGIKLRAEEWVNGVRVTGTVNFKGTGHVTVGGPAASAGALTLRKGRIAGTLGGVRVHD